MSFSGLAIGLKCNACEKKLQMQKKRKDDQKIEKLINHSTTSHRSLHRVTQGKSKLGEGEVPVKAIKAITQSCAEAARW
jgi:hypothetical protein